ncbi:DNA alkylation repair protein [Streptococcus pneumoniae]|nr:DNA alkylation repair protein [Streptococcus pneumoniae]QBF69357.1 DNA alkylation repair protein [Streptococcus pneumoniae]TVV55125.1 DNA alkylation repair protein [Streptococcus pneumoniae]TVV56248.1 DNA alkylation repair protein [Streptococcus pneumoniae]TVV94393.1 DNA alkylation repair protein [Streptococcus pneumoniae]
MQEIILFENIFKPGPFYPQSQSGTLSNLWSAP